MYSLKGCSAHVLASLCIIERNTFVTMEIDEESELHEPTKAKVAFKKLIKNNSFIQTITLSKVRQNSFLKCIPRIASHGDAAAFKVEYWQLRCSILSCPWNRETSSHHISAVFLPNRYSFFQSRNITLPLNE
jgi:hypothetical protein